MLKCVWLCNPLPGFSVHGIFQARILEQVAISSSRGSSWPRDRTHISFISCIGRQIFYHCTTWEASRINGYLSVSHFWESWGTPRGGKLHSKESRPSFSRQSGIYIEPFGSKHLYFNVFKYGIFSSFLCWWNKHPESCCMFKKKVKKALTPKF